MEDDAKDSTTAGREKEPAVIQFAFRGLRKVEDGKWVATCRHCNSVLTENYRTTSTFTRHLQRKHISVYKQYMKERPQLLHANNLDPSPNTSHSHQSLKSFLATAECEYQKHYPKSHPRQAMLADSVVQNLIIGCNLPVSLVDHPKFRQCFHDFDSKFSMPCRQTVSMSMIPGYLEVRKKLLMDHLKDAQHVALTADVWTDRRAHAFLGVTVHSLLNGEPKAQLMAFRSFSGSHTGSAIADAMESIMNEFDVASKVCCIVTDNASNMKRAMCILFSELLTQQEDTDVSDEYFDDASLWRDLEEGETVNDTVNVGRRLPCFAHSLQLVVRDGLQSATFARGAFGKVSKLANLVHQSALFREAYESTFGSNSTIPETNATRWNSVWMQLNAVVNVDQQKLSDLLKSTAHENLSLTARELQQLQEVVEILAPFAELTDVCQGDKSTTISCVVPGLLNLLQQLNELEQTARHSSTLIQSLRQGLHIRFAGMFRRLKIAPPANLSGCTNKDLGFDDDIFFMAAALDPSFGFRWLEDLPDGSDAQEELRQYIIGCLHKELRFCVETSTADMPDTPTLNQPPAKKAKVSLFGRYRVTATQSGSSQEKTPIQVLAGYMEMLAVTQMQLPDVYKLEQFATIRPLLERVLCVPASSAPVERIFSQSGLVMRPNRARMSNKLLEELVFLKCNE